MTVGEMVRWYEGLNQADQPWGRTKAADLAKLRGGSLKDARVDKLTAADFIAHVRKRREDGAGPATASNDLIWLRQVLRAARVELRVPVPLHALDDAAEHLRRNRVIAKPQERERRLKPGEEARILAHFASRTRNTIPMHDNVPFALATARRRLWRSATSRL